MDIIHITVAYSNAVLTAVLPHLADFSERLNLAPKSEITAAQVVHSGMIPYKGLFANAVTFSNQYYFYFHWHGTNRNLGYVQSFRAPTNLFTEQEFTNSAMFAGKDNMTTNDVIAMARDSLGKLGYSTNAHFAEAPVLKGPYDLKNGEHIPYCRVTWDWLVGTNFPHENWITVDINMESKKLVGMELMFSPEAVIPLVPIKVDVIPELESSYKKPPKTNKMYINTNAPKRLPGNPLEK